MIEDGNEPSLLASSSSSPALVLGGPFPTLFLPGPLTQSPQGLCMSCPICLESSADACFIPTQHISLFSPSPRLGHMILLQAHGACGWVYHCVYWGAAD